MEQRPQSRLRTWMTRLKAKPAFTSLFQFVKFGLVGVSNTLISLGVYQLCLHILHMHYQLANLLSFLVSVTNAYYWNSRYVFTRGASPTPAQHLRAYGKAFVSYGSTFLLSTVLLTLWVEVFGISQGLAPVINLLITIPLNFLLNKHWAFRQKKPTAAESPSTPETTPKEAP